MAATFLFAVFLALWFFGGFVYGDGRGRGEVVIWGVLLFAFFFVFLGGRRGGYLRWWVVVVCGALIGGNVS